MSTTTQIDPALTLLLMEASLQAYNAYDGDHPARCVSNAVTAPAGWDFVECFTGVDSVFFKEEQRVESFGVVFRSKTAPYTYIFAFRGTVALLDAIEDAAFFEGKDTFLPFGATRPPDPGAAVASGFWSIYTESTSQVTSMQAQVFALLAKYQASARPASRLLVTGHSLGSALAVLFSLDLAFSQYRSLPAPHVNFACPRVGNAPFARLYDGQPQQQSLATRTVRVQNTYDLVPCGPPTWWPFEYRHVTDAFLIAFYNKNAGWLDPRAKFYDHQAFNYQAVLACAFKNKARVCVNDALFVPADGETLVSLAPDPNTACSLFAEADRARQAAYEARRKG